MVSNICLFSPRKLGKIPILTYIFQRGWTHPLGTVEYCWCQFVCFPSSWCFRICDPRHVPNSIEDTNDSMGEMKHQPFDEGDPPPPPTTTKQQKTNKKHFTYCIRQNKKQNKHEIASSKQQTMINNKTYKKNRQETMNKQETSITDNNQPQPSINYNKTNIKKSWDELVTLALCAFRIRSLSSLGGAYTCRMDPTMKPLKDCIIYKGAGGWWGCFSAKVAIVGLKLKRAKDKI